MKVGQVVTFGHYYQRGEMDYADDIEWYILKVDDERDCAMLISKYMIDEQKYSEESRIYATWETSVIREWLNHDFYENAFSAGDRQKIRLSLLDNSYSDPNRILEYKQYKITPGADTLDYVFLISVEEYGIMMEMPEMMNADMTGYAARQLEGTIGENEKAKPCWWTRIPVKGTGTALLINEKGRITGQSQQRRHGIRPVIWVDKSVIISE